jgi:hypothetical protein
MDFLVSFEQDKQGIHILFYSKLLRIYVNLNKKEEKKIYELT